MPALDWQSVSALDWQSVSALDRQLASALDPQSAPALDRQSARVGLAINAPAGSATGTHGWIGNRCPR
jgi:hypothetical protein